MENTTNKEVTGKIVHINDDKGFGFITSSEIKFERIFFHWTSLVLETKKFTELKLNMKVKCEVYEVFPTDEKPKQKGWRAIRIEVITNDKVETIKDTIRELLK